MIRKIARAISRERRIRANHCKVEDCWCARHVGMKYCRTHDYLWMPGEELPCNGWAVAICA